MKKPILILLLTVLVVGSCSEPLIEDYIEGTWKLTEYLRNDVDETNSIFIENYEETYMIDGTFSRSYIDGKQDTVVETGTYSINDDNSSIHLSDISSISEFSEDHSTLSTSTIEVISITDNEYAYSFENGGDLHEFRFILK